ncbi:MAG: GTP-binding protein [Candidatus Scalindua sp. AMX11]|nr:MAG: GTP-binding protein [Candidatus Scalindua sp.]NOG86136.1 GTP-binding protein [Planctomycetota bacterium]RZV98898.1 MAG: GTP-binding protein [Candidatus Scalindua sp. SCAELEC01]TDE66910.1 MAG: GTP-binding protein [Candidatus Scalindua sp. AMX11]GJQ57714.1 MAG: tRNA modification GTPase MnmE [Candidatus Scalindua sp.]
MNRETIASIVTPIGEGGIGVVQVSGPRSREIVNTVFRGKRSVDLRTVPSRTLHYGKIYMHERAVDEVIVNTLREEDSYTGEDLVEVNCHGGIQAVKKTLECMLSAGAQEADWEALTERARMNGKIDLIQAEAYGEIPQAKTRLSAKVLVDQYHGVLSSFIRGLIKNMGYGKSEQQLPHIRERLSEILETAAFGRAITSPRRLVIAGRPNVGKSTLINALLKEERSIVHGEPGTTRDAIDVLVEVSGIPFTIVDTAGMRETIDTVEKLGVSETRNQLRAADTILYLLDSSIPIENEDRELFESIMEISRDSQKCSDSRRNSVIIVVNKMDLSQKLDTSVLGREHAFPLCRISALQYQGFSALEEALTGEFSEFIQYTPKRAIIFTGRQQKHLSRAFEISEKCVCCIQENKGLGNVSNYVSEIKRELQRCIGEYRFSDFSP